MTGDSVQEQKMELSGIATPEGRTEFFTVLMRDIPGYKLFDVTAVKVHSRIAVVEAQQDTAEETGDLESLGMEDIDAEEEMLGVVRHALLSGSSLLTSREYQALRSSGFYISKAVWISQGEQGGRPKVEFEASIGNPAEGTDFKYAVRGVYRMMEGGSYRRQSERPAEGEKLELLGLIESTARQAIDRVTAKIEVTSESR